MKGRNITLDLNINCPSCGSSDVCENECICPACWLPSIVTEGQRDQSVWAWREFAPLLDAMNKDSIPWGWATEQRSNGQPHHSIEVLRQDDDTWYEVETHESYWLVTHWRRTRGIRETNTPPSWEPIDEVSCLTVDEATNFMSPAIRRQ